MGTRSIVRFILVRGKKKGKFIKLAAIYGQWDGFLDAVGKTLADFLLKIVDGYGRAARPMGEWVAEYIAQRKRGAGNDYFYHARLASDQEYTYNVYVEEETHQVIVAVDCRETGGKPLPLTVQAFHKWCTALHDKDSAVRKPTRAPLTLKADIPELKVAGSDVDADLNRPYGALVRFRQRNPETSKYRILAAVYHVENGGPTGVGRALAEFLLGFIDFNTMELASWMPGNPMDLSVFGRIEERAAATLGKVANGLDCLVAQYVRTAVHPKVVVSASRQAPFVYTVNLDIQKRDVFVSVAVGNELVHANLSRAAFSYYARRNGQVDSFPDRVSRRQARLVPQGVVDYFRNDEYEHAFYADCRGGGMQHHPRDKPVPDDLMVYAQDGVAAMRKRYAERTASLDSRPAKKRYCTRSGNGV